MELSRSPEKRARRILVVDQDEAGRERLKSLLIGAHPEYEVQFAADTAGAMDVLRDRTPDLVFLDVLMPDNEGFDLCVLMKADERFKDLPLLIITSLDNPEHRVRVFKSGASDYIVKPPHAEETIARVEGLLRLKSFQDRQKELNAELRRTQSALLDSTKMSAVGTLANGVAHEFNNVLQIIGAAAELLTAGADAEDSKKMAETIVECTRRGGRIAKALMDFSRREELQKKEEVRLEEVVNQTLKLLAKGISDAGVRVETRLSPVPVFRGYPGQLSQVIVHLVRNAVEAMEGAQEKTLSVALVRCGCAEADVCGADPLGQRPSGRGCASLSISDTGHGVSRVLRDKIFEPFVTTKGVLGGGSDRTPGTGLGLSVSYGIVRRHEGYIGVRSEEGKGATFTISLPLGD